METDDYVIGYLREMNEVVIVQTKHALRWTYREDEWRVLPPDAHRSLIDRLKGAGAAPGRVHSGPARRRRLDPGDIARMVRSCRAAYKNWVLDPGRSARDIREAAQVAHDHARRQEEAEALRRSCASRGISLETHQAEQRALQARSTSARAKAAVLVPTPTREQQAALWSAEYARARAAVARETESLGAAVSRWERDADPYGTSVDEVRTAVVARGEAWVGRLTADLRKLADAARTRARQADHHAGEIAAAAREAERAAGLVRAAAAPRDVCQNVDDALACVRMDLSVARAVAAEAAVDAGAFEAGLRSLVGPFLDAVRGGLDQLIHERERASREAREARAREIRAFCDARGITRVVHFTRVENLEGIVRHGLLTREALESGGLPVRVSDDSRNDGVRDSISLSIEFPNYRMFYDKRQRLGGLDSRWVVLELEPRILWECRCLFLVTNASRTQSDRERRTEPRHLEELFGDAPATSGRPGVRRSDLGIPDCYTTDVQAEVMALDPIPFDQIRAIHFGDGASAEAFRRNYPAHASLAQVSDSLFLPRSDYAAQSARFPSRSQEHA